MIAAGCALAAGCRMGPDYRRPSVDLRDAYRGAVAEARSLGDLRWFEVFEDPALRVLIGAALEQSPDLGVAAARIAQLEATLGIVRADQLPGLEVRGTGSRERLGRSSFAPELEAITLNNWRLEGVASWYLDFWGKYRRASEAARADLLAEHWNRRAVITMLIADVASGYFQLQALDLELEIARRTHAARERSLELVRMRESRGTSSLLDVRQAEQLVAVAARTIADLERQIEQTENLVRTLLGAKPGPIHRSRGLPERADVVPAGLPSALLERRPDIREAEARLIAANARIGVARAAYFPDIALTARGGFQSAVLADLISKSSTIWALVAQVTQPIFAGGRLRAEERLAEARRDEALFLYQKAIVNAFRDVSDALIAVAKSRESRLQQQRLVDAASDAARLSRRRYEAGADSYLEVLDSETRAFDAELELARARLEELLALVRLYQALGGGWRHAG